MALGPVRIFGLAHQPPLWRASFFTLATVLACSIALGMACLFLEWRWAIAALLLFLAFVLLLIRGARETLLLLVVLRPLIDWFVYLKIGSVTLGQAWAIALLGVTAYGVFSGQLGTLNLRRDAAVIAFCAIAVITIARTPTLSALTDYSHFFAWFLLIPALGSHETRGADPIPELFRCGKLLLLGAVIAGWAALVLNQYGIAYYSGTLESAVQSPHGLSFLIVLSLAFLKPLGERNRALLILILVAAMTAVFGSLVRSTSLAGLLVAGALLWSAYPRKTFRWYASTASVLGLCLLIVLPYAPILITRYSDIALLATPDYSNAGSGRIAIWTTYFDYLNSEGVFGWIFGLGADGPRQIIETKLGAPLYAHSDPLMFLVAGGIPMLLGYLWVLTWLVGWALQGIRADQPEVRKFGLIATFSVVAYILVSFMNGAFFYQASIGLALSLAICRSATRNPRPFNPAS